MEFRVTLEWEATVGGRRVERSWDGVNWRGCEESSKEGSAEYAEGMLRVLLSSP